MIALPCPTKTVKDVVQLVVGAISKNTKFKRNLNGALTDLVSAEAEYERLGKVGELFKVNETGQVQNFTLKNMKDLYENRLAKRGHPANAIYIELLKAPKHSRCPLCTIGLVKTLDHYLAKSKFAALTVVPMNLVPACRDCNTTKLAKTARAAKDQSLHPYFDRLQQGVWLHCEIVQGPAPVPKYTAKPPSDWNPVMAERVNAHLVAFDLASRFADTASAELSDIRESLRETRTTGGRDALRQHLAGEAARKTSNGPNSWSAALYRALAASEWFLSEGCLLIGE